MYYHISNIKLESNNEIKETDMSNCACYHFDGTIKINDLDLDNILLDEKSFFNFLIYDVAYVTPDGATLRNIFDKEDGCIRKYNRPKYLALFYSDEKVYSHKYAKIKINSDDDLLLENIPNMHNAIKLFKSVVIIIAIIIIMKHFCYYN